MTPPRADLLQGTLDLLILKALSLGPRHGYGMIQRIRQLSDEMLTVEQGALYPALYRIEQKGWISSTWSGVLIEPSTRRTSKGPAERRDVASANSTTSELMKE